MQPNDPYGQQSGYPAPGYPMPGYPAPGMPAAYDPYVAAYGPMGPYGAPSGGTAITAIVLAYLGVAAGVVGMITSIVGLSLGTVSGAHRLPVFYWASAIFDLIPITLLAIGATMMIRRRQAGRILVVAGCAVTLLAGVVGGVVTGVLAGTGGNQAGAYLIGVVIGAVLAMIPPVVTVVLALLPATLRWLQAPQMGVGPGIAHA
ncbi:hypothetical protein [Gordonia crocea]|uniref:Uncharacterized protein n=1 Tax=Gordonia crocea TaxID=589162 RepID=A0A7I9UUL9_9ACTN|nr:hypothetical protein [Gordonia crocea]GED96844.1 hypothetical protein nbrc107697_08830 [Gordonia crocea]